MKEIDKGNDIVYQCEECGLVYKEKVWTEKCEIWCAENHSCNLEIIEHAEKTINSLWIIK